MGAEIAAITAGPADHEAERPHPGQTVLEPQPAHDRAPDRGDSVRHGQESGAERLGRVGIQQEGHRRVERTDHQQRFPVPTDDRNFAAPQGNRQQEQRRQAHAQFDQRDRTEVRHRQAHEQKRAAPDGGQYQKVQQITLTHAFSPGLRCLPARGQILHLDPYAAVGDQDADHRGAEGAADGAGGLDEGGSHAHVAALAEHLHEQGQVRQQEAERAAVDEEGRQDPPGRGAGGNQQHHQRTCRQQPAAEHHQALRFGLPGEEAAIDDAADRNRGHQRRQQQARFARGVSEHLLQQQGAVEDQDEHDGADHHGGQIQKP
ncbi:hypothetical protein BBAD15_g12382 [Beauveria bassiana D1-5]|uniref:Uncharacterized protein n=1 Tax=Beauveria bassiana D1-5 TaxID=1245745 RepID=A0A0A2V4J2_BEABA|nr:hypothetical protein BBAD15_g12382 [Beauveria bassiana D1-5]